MEYNYRAGVTTIEEVLIPDSVSDFQKLLDTLPVPAGEYNQQQMILGLVLNKIMPALFLIIDR
ncbi:MAG: hypothetical protein ACI4HI_02200 [Lachnospiraceae bacterium]